MAPKLQISLTGSNKVHYSGNTITGNVLLDVNKNKSYQRISIQFTGRSLVSWTGKRAESVENLSDDDDRRPRRSSNLPCTATESYVNVVTTLWKSQNNGKLTPDQYSWPFSFDIPQSAPSSFEGTVGNIRYTLVGQIVSGKTKVTSDHSVELQIPVQQIVKITNPRLLQPMHQEVQKTIESLCCSSQPIVMSVSVPKTGFDVGESFHLLVSLENGSGRRITISAVIKQLVTYIAQGGQQNTNEKTLVMIESNQMPARAIRNWDPTIEIPAADIIYETACNNIKITHTLTITGKIFNSLNLFTFFPIQIGNCDQIQTEAALAVQPTPHLTAQQSTDSQEKYPLSNDQPPTPQTTHWTPTHHPPHHPDSGPPPYASVGGFTYEPPSAPPGQQHYGSKSNVFVY